MLEEEKEFRVPTLPTPSFSIFSTPSSFSFPPPALIQGFSEGQRERERERERKREITSFRESTRKYSSEVTFSKHPKGGRAIKYKFSSNIDL